MDVIFLSNNPVNSKVIQAEDDNHIYDVSTERMPESRDVYSTTTVRRPSGKVVALWEWSAHNRYQDRITYLGDVHTLSEWLAKESPFSRTRLVVPANGTKYSWKQKGFSIGSSTKLELRQLESGRAVASAGHVHTGSGSERESRIKITLQPEAASAVDVVVLSFMIFEVVRRERGEAKNWGAFWVGAGAVSIGSSI
ncbi:hypothetical protein L227DRAFT_574154 [Lentinus tigrinus ALCF2SS1-6]|uniref:DUF6593 domain-containing protein n=1 Tax=Lentinus tigrinus ALCF2SS1-6 TaxID=1328759 RepID=A0A5C2SD00_9APHY|nr:hypothetical protein L227DRAFT_574154 [Lentinus tigrinus ALCF2SS1-6]